MSYNVYIPEIYRNFEDLAGCKPMYQNIFAVGKEMIEKEAVRSSDGLRKEQIGVGKGLMISFENLKDDF